MGEQADRLGDTIRDITTRYKPRNARICTKCSNELRVVKTGFHHLGPDGGVRSGDLYHCKACDRFQLHGIPDGAYPYWPLFGVVLRGQRTRETEPNSYWSAYLSPKIFFLSTFHTHLRKWYPELLTSKALLEGV